ncbi:MAG: TMEM165/GDT1 family protein [Promethearchaeota archaeon]
MLQFLIALLSAFGIIFVMELGDKTQLVIFTLCTRKYSAKILALGACAGFTIVVILGGLIATIISGIFSLSWISLVSGTIFIILGIIQALNLIKERKRERIEGCSEGTEAAIGAGKDSPPKIKSTNSFVIGMVSIISMEMGDKTQVATILLASTSGYMVATLLGSWLALSLLAVIGAFAGYTIAKKVPKKYMDIIATILFIGIGIFITITATMDLLA